MRLIVFCILWMLSCTVAANTAKLVAVCEGHKKNDILDLLQIKVEFDSLHDALQTADNNTGILVLSCNYPDRAVKIDNKDLQKAAKLGVKLYIEYPDSLHGLPVEGGQIELDSFSRIVITSEDTKLPQNQILMQHGVSYTNFTFEKSDYEYEQKAVFSWVAGYRHALYGLAGNTTALFEYRLPNNYSILVCTTKFSNVIRGRSNPIEDWATLWNYILEFIAPGGNYKISPWKPTVYPAYSKDEPLPANAEMKSFYLASDWAYTKSGLFYTGGRKSDNSSVLSWCPAPLTNDTSQVACILQGFASGIMWNGSHPINPEVRMDCNGPVAMLLAYRYLIDGDENIKEDVVRMLDYLFFYSLAQQAERGDQNNSAFGLLAWGVSSPAWFASLYGDSDASMILPILATTSILNSNRWDEGIVKNFLGNIRTTGQNGFRSGSIPLGELGKNGWEYYFEMNNKYSDTHWPQPHYSSFLWAEFLWAYAHTGFDLFFNRTYTAIKMTMEAYPYNWRWTEYMTEEQAKFLVSLAWLVRVHDTQETRRWLKLIAVDFLASQQPFGAVNEKLGPHGSCDFCPPGNNWAYGHSECGLSQDNSDPVTDMLYTHNFAVMGLREAYRATGDQFYYDAETKMIEYLIRIQARSTVHPTMDGAWMRSFDFELWDYFGSASDLGWGPWSVETGWSEGWIGGTIAERFMETSIWEISQSSTIGPHLIKKWCPVFFTGKYSALCDEYNAKLRKND